MTIVSVFKPLEISLDLRHIDRYLKNGVSKSIVSVIKHASFQLYVVQHDGVI